MSGTLGMVFSLLASLVFPVAVLAACVLRPSWRKYVFPFVLGVATFVVFQNCIRIPLLQYVLSGQTWYILFRQAQPVWNIILVGGVSAGLFEEGGRFAVMHILKPHRRTVAAAVFFGLGHGGVEAAQVGVQLLASWLAAPYLVSVQPWFATAAGGIERLMAMALHVGLSALVMHAVNKKRWWLLPVAILVHAAANSATVLTLQMTGSALLGELVFLPFSAVMVVFTCIQYKREKKAEVS